MTHVERFIFVKQAITTFKPAKTPPSLASAGKKLKDIRKTQRQQIEKARLAVSKENEKLKKDIAKHQQAITNQQMEHQQELQQKDLEAKMLEMKHQQEKQISDAQAEMMAQQAPPGVPVAPPSQTPYQGMPGQLPPDEQQEQQQQGQAGQLASVTPPMAAVPGMTSPMQPSPQ